MIKIVVLILILEVANGYIDAPSKKTKSPNVVLIVTDDQDVVLQGLIPMKATQVHLGLKGITFLNAFTSSPICCPSRASILSGLYAHNHGTTNNTMCGGCYGSFWKEKIEPQALPVILQSNGYETFFAGKYLNEYFSNQTPPGWNHFYGLHGNSKYYNYTLNENGKVVQYGSMYLTDVLAEKTTTFLKQRSSEKPFFIMVTPPAPHAPFTAADRHNSSFEDVKALRTPNFNIRSGSLDKHWLVQMGEILKDPLINLIDTYYRKRWQSLLAVDEFVNHLIKTMENSGEIENSYIIYTSDNGYHIGQFSQPYDKRQPYETDIRVPFLVRGPKVPQKAVTSFPIALIDIAPTILDWIGVETPTKLDGVSFASIISTDKFEPTPDKHFHRQILIEYWGEGTEETYNPDCPWKKSDRLALCTLDADCHCQDAWNNTYSCIRHFAHNTDMLYCEFKDEENFVEAYDLQNDPYQMSNLGYELLPSERAMYNIALQNLTKCSGESCRHTKF